MWNCLTKVNRNALATGQINLPAACAKPLLCFNGLSALIRQHAELSGQRNRLRIPVQQVLGKLFADESSDGDLITGKHLRQHEGDL